MLVYFTAIFYAYYVVIYARKVTRFLYPLMVLPLVLFSTLRGESGKDTELYIYRFENIDGLFTLRFDSEPVINLLIYLGHTIDSHRAFGFFFVHSLLVVSCFYYLSRNFEKARSYLLVVGPIFLIDGITNGMRITMAYHFFAISFISSRYWLFFVMSFFSQISISFSYFLNFFLRKIVVMSWIKKVLFTSIVFVFALISFWAGDYLLQFFPRVSSKLNSYQGLVLNTGYSGIADIYIIFSLLVVSAFYNLSCLKSFLISVFFILFFCLALFFTTRISLAFIRVFKLIIIAICFSPFLLECERRIPSRVLFFIGLPYTLNFMRQVVTDSGFLPYGEEWF